MEQDTAKQIKDQMNLNSVTEQKCTDLKEELATEQQAKANVINDLEASRQAEKLARDEVQQKQFELKQAIIDEGELRTCQRSLTTVSSRQKPLERELALAKRKAPEFERHASEAVADADSLRTEVTKLTTAKDFLESELDLAKSKASQFERTARKAV